MSTTAEAARAEIDHLNATLRWARKNCTSLPSAVIFGDAIGHEALWCMETVYGQMIDHGLERLDCETRIDTERRLAGPCDLCRDEQHHGLAIDGGDALCEGCLGAPEEAA